MLEQGRQKSQSLQPVRRKWSKVVEPLMKYSKGKSSLSIPLNFFQQIQKMLELGYSVNLNIPQTLTGTHDNYLYTNFSNPEQPIGQIKFESQLQKAAKESIKKIRSKQIVEDFFEEYEQTLSSKIFWFPFVVMKQKISISGRVETNTMVWNSYEYKKISNIDVNQIAQAYIFTKNMTASVTRFSYFPKSGKSVAYKIDNHDSFVSKKKSKYLWKVKQDREGSCTFIKVMHQNKSFYEQTLNLVQNIQKYSNKEVCVLVTDWIIDANNKYYLVDVKQIELIEPKQKSKVCHSLNKLLSTLTCNMCLQTCSQSEISKILTNKLINKFYDHLKKRGVQLSFKINCRKMANLSRVCDLCYNLVVEESKLMEAERKMSIACNFANSSETEDLFEKDDYIQPFGVQRLYKWRLFFYLQDIKNFFKIFSLGDSNKKQDMTSLFLSLQFHDTVTHFQISSPFHNDINVKAIKVEHILSQTDDISGFLQKAEVRVQISPKPNSSKPIAEGCLHGIQNSEGNTSSGQSFLQRKYKQILVFNQNSKYCVLGMYVGICNDGLTYTSGMKLRKSMGVYRIQSNNIDCKILPPEWMEIIDQNYCPAKTKLDDSEQTSDDLPGQWKKNSKVGFKTNTNSIMNMMQDSKRRKLVL